MTDQGLQERVERLRAVVAIGPEQQKVVEDAADLLTAALRVVEATRARVTTSRCLKRPDRKDEPDPGDCGRCTVCRQRAALAEWDALERKP